MPRAFTILKLSSGKVHAGHQHLRTDVFFSEWHEGQTFWRLKKGQGNFWGCSQIQRSEESKISSSNQQPLFFLIYYFFFILCDSWSRKVFGSSLMTCGPHIMKVSWELAARGRVLTDVHSCTERNTKRDISSHICIQTKTHWQNHPRVVTVKNWFVFLLTDELWRGSMSVSVLCSVQ